MTDNDAQEPAGVQWLMSLAKDRGGLLMGVNLLFLNVVTLALLIENRAISKAALSEALETTLQEFPKLIAKDIKSETEAKLTTITSEAALIPLALIKKMIDELPEPPPNIKPRDPVQTTDLIVRAIEVCENFFGLTRSREDLDSQSRSPRGT